MILLDTQAVVWWAARMDKLSAEATVAIDRARSIGVSPLSAFEVATLVRRGRLRLAFEPQVWWSSLVAQDGVEVVGLDLEAALRAGACDERCPGDPIDRMLLATARATGRTLVTADRRLRAFAPDETLW